MPFHRSRRFAPVRPFTNWMPRQPKPWRGLDVSPSIQRSLKWITLMVARCCPPVPIDLDSAHCVAICEEVGYRLDRYLKKELPDASPELARLIARLRQLDRVN